MFYMLCDAVCAVACVQSVSVCAVACARFDPTRFTFRFYPFRLPCARFGPTRFDFHVHVSLSIRPVSIRPVSIVMCTFRSDTFRLPWVRCKCGARHGLYDARHVLYVTLAMVCM